MAVDPDGVDDVLAAARGAGVPAVELGVAGGDRFRVAGADTGAGAGDTALVDLALADLTATWRDRIPNALGAGTTQA
jgi:hypothetical protein